MSSLFHAILLDPLFNSLVLLYKYVTFEDLGLAIILLTIIIRFLLYPLFYKAFRNQSLMQKIQPEIKRIQVEHKENKDEQVKQMMALWKEHKVNPFSSFGILLIQLPVIFAVYHIFLVGFSEEAFANLYSFISAPVDPSNSFLGLINLSQPNMIVVGLAVIAQYFQSRLSLPRNVDKNDASAKMSRNMTIVAPLLTLIILPRLSAAIGLYWLTATVFSIFQQYFINKSIYGNKPRTNSVDHS